MKNAAYYLRDIEEIINTHGIRKVARSSKVRMLHSIYLYLCVLTERASIKELGPQNDHREPSDLLVLSSTEQISTWNRLIGHSMSKSSSEILDSKCIVDDTSQKSMFEEIYSVPQSLFNLILQTTHLSAVIERMQIAARPQTVDHEMVATRVKELESSICNWEYQANDGPTYIGCTPLHHRERFPRHLIQAVHNALIVYFYRRVKDVNAKILQMHVQETIHHLVEYDKQKERLNDQSSNTCWPGFIAGCEAIDPKLREMFSEWLERCGQSTGIRMFTIALEALRKVWQAREVPGMQDAPWNQVLQQFSDFKVLVLS